MSMTPEDTTMFQDDSNGNKDGDLPTTQGKVFDTLPFKPSCKTIREWEEGKKQLAPPNPTIPSEFPDFKSYYRAFPALHPCHPFDTFANKNHTNSTLHNVIFTDNFNNPVHGTSNIKLSLEVLGLELPSEYSGLRLTLRLRACWYPALSEMRSFPPVTYSYQLGEQGEEQQQAEHIVQYESLPEDEHQCQQTILQSRTKLGHTLMVIEDQMALMQQKEIPFYGPEISFRTTCGTPGDPTFLEEELESTKALGIMGHIYTKGDAFIPALGSTARMICAEDHFDLSPLCDGGKRAFPFEEQTITLHIHSMRGIRDLAFHELDQMDENDLKQKIVQLASVKNDWRVIDVQLFSCYRNAHGEEFSTASDDISTTSHLDSIRSKITLKVTFAKSRSYWFMKIIFPLDIITVTGFSVLLVTPTLSSSTPAEKLACLTFLAGILTALAAFTISTGAILPKLGYITAFDIHSYVCFTIIAILAMLVSALPIQILQPQDHHPHGLFFGLLLLAFALEHSFLYVFVRWVWTQPLQQQSIRPAGLYNYEKRFPPIVAVSPPMSPPIVAMPPAIIPTITMVPNHFPGPSISGPPSVVANETDSVQQVGDLIFMDSRHCIGNAIPPNVVVIHRPRQKSL